MYQADVAIIGLGPAGATLARLLAPHMRVLALDGQPLRREKPCGGLLAPDAQKALASLGLTLPKEILVSPQIFAVKTMDIPAKQVRYYPRSYVNLSRHAFDRWLVSLIPATCQRITGVCRSIRREGDGFSIACALPGGEQATVRARYVVGAEGANSLVRKTFFPSHPVKPYVAVQQWFSRGEMDPFYSCVFDRRVKGLCSWSITKDDLFLFGGAYDPKGCRQSFEQQKKALEAQGFAFGQAMKTEACLVARPRALHGPCLGGGGVFLIGEAAGFLSPSSLEGISWALRSAVCLAKALRLSNGNPHGAYRKSTRSLRARLFGKALKCPFLYRPALRYLVMKSGLQAISLTEQAKEMAL